MLHLSCRKTCNTTKSDQQIWKSLPVDVIAKHAPILAGLCIEYSMLVQVSGTGINHYFEFLKP